MITRHGVGAIDTFKDQLRSPALEVSSFTMAAPGREVVKASKKGPVIQDGVRWPDE